MKYLDQIVYEEQSRYQKIVITRWKDYHWLYLNNSVQFSSYDEAMYHEPLVQIPLYLAGSRNRILILGGGDGCAAREALKFNDVRSVTLVDIDPAMTRIARENDILTSINDSSLFDTRVKVINRDAFNFLEESKDIFDVIIADFPDPRNSDLSRLYSEEFYIIVRKHLSKDGIFITQAGSPYFAFKAFSSIDTTIKVSGFNTMRVRNHVPTMGEWGFVIASPELSSEALHQRFLGLKVDEKKTRWLTQSVLPGLISFGKQPGWIVGTIKVNTLKDPVLHKYFEEGDWGLY